MAQAARGTGAQRGASDIKVANAGAEVPLAPGEVDLSKIDLPADVVAAVEGEAEAVAPTKKPVRTKKAPVKAE